MPSAKNKVKSLIYLLALLCLSNSAAAIALWGFFSHTRQLKQSMQLTQCDTVTQLWHSWRQLNTTAFFSHSLERNHVLLVKVEVNEILCKQIFIDNYCSLFCTHKNQRFPYFFAWNIFLCWKYFGFKTLGLTMSCQCPPSSLPPSLPRTSSEPVSRRQTRRRWWEIAKISKTCQIDKSHNICQTFSSFVKIAGDSVVPVQEVNGPADENSWGMQSIFHPLRQAQWIQKTTGLHSSLKSSKTPSPVSPF